MFKRRILLSLIGVVVFLIIFVAYPILKHSKQIERVGKNHRYIVQEKNKVPEEAPPIAKNATFEKTENINIAPEDYFKEIEEFCKEIDSLTAIMWSLQKKYPDLQKRIKENLGYVAEMIKDTSKDYRFRTILVDGLPREAGTNEKCVSSLISVLGDEEEALPLRYSTIQALGWFKSESAYPLLVEISHTNEEPEDLQARAITALAQVKGKESLSDILLELKSSRFYPQLAAIHATEKLEAEGAVSSLEEILKQELSNQAILDKSPTVSSQEPLGKEKDEIVKMHTVKAISTIQGEKARSMLVEIAEDKTLTTDVRATAIDELGKLERKDTVLSLLGLTEDEEEYIRFKAIRSLIKIKKNSDNSELKEQINSLLIKCLSQEQSSSIKSTIEKGIR